MTSRPLQATLEGMSVIRIGTRRIHVSSKDRHVSSKECMSVLRIGTRCTHELRSVAESTSDACQPCPGAVLPVTEPRTY